jgi:alkanesulfonate monooxygenase SsuD/methylene tetrahydromethanopterin reductase-like flavin-dependent oxidoreductase (luciferase family)
MFTLRFDMRAPDWAAPAADLYAAAIDMCAWAETRGAMLAVLSEHHGADDGHLPTPLILASAIAAGTTRLAILLAAVPLPLWDPVRLAEEMSVLDLISKGRVLYALGVGHRSEEYGHFGVDMATRGRRYAGRAWPADTRRTRRVSGPPDSGHSALLVGVGTSDANRRGQ